MNIYSFTGKFTDEKIPCRKEGNKYFYADAETLAASSKIKGALSAGIPLGEEHKGVFRPSIYLLELLSGKTKNKIFISDKAEWLFLCGRDVLPESIIKDDSSSDVFLVQNGRDENLGLGRKVNLGGKEKGQKGSKGMKGGGKYFIRNILDRGDFLRRERK